MTKVLPGFPGVRMLQIKNVKVQLQWPSTQTTPPCGMSASSNHEITKPVIYFYWPSSDEATLQMNDVNTRWGPGSELIKDARQEEGQGLWHMGSSLVTGQ